MSTTEFTKLKAATYFACTALIATAIPATASAVTGTSIFITDPSALAHKARVDTSGRLAVKAQVSGGTVDVGKVAPPTAPYAATCQSQDFSSLTDQCSYGLGRGQRMVVQMVSAQCAGNAATQDGVDIEFTYADVNGGVHTIFIPPTLEGGSGAAFAANQSMTVYVGAGAPMSVLCRVGTAQDLTVDATISGYLY